MVLEVDEVVEVLEDEEALEEDVVEVVAEGFKPTWCQSVSYTQMSCWTSREVKWIFALGSMLVHGWMIVGLLAFVDMKT